MSGGRIEKVVGDTLVRHRYTAGLANERFIKGLAKRRITASRCPVCGVLRVPPAIFCEECFTATDDFVTLPARGVVTSFTVLHEDRFGKRLPRPETAVLVGFIGASGGLVSRMVEDEEELFVGMPVEPVFREKPRGDVGDLEGFRPTKG